MDPIDHSPRNRSEAGIAGDGIIAECDRNIVEIRRVRRPQIGRRIIEREVLVGVDLVRELTTAGVAGGDGDLSGSAGVLGGRDGAEDCPRISCGDEKKLMVRLLPFPCMSAFKFRSVM